MSAGIGKLAFNPASIAASYKRLAPIPYNASTAVPPASNPLPTGQTDQGQADLENDNAAVSRSVDGTNEWLAARNRSIRFRLRENSDRVQVQVVDPKSNRILSTIPSDEMLRFSERMRELSGLGAKVDTSR
ncbi:MAG: flagellar protein FlaG [Planctomycetota bacterium]|nr:flagellar protein FlaG [Planctomycetota bacterium]